MILPFFFCGCINSRHEPSHWQKIRAELAAGDTALAEEQLLDEFSRGNSCHDACGFRDYFLRRANTAVFDLFSHSSDSLRIKRDDALLSGQALLARADTMLSRNADSAASRLAILAYLHDTLLTGAAERICRTADGKIYQRRLARMTPARRRMVKNGDDVIRIPDTTIRNRLFSLVFYYAYEDRSTQESDPKELSVMKYLILFFLTESALDRESRATFQENLKQCAFREISRSKAHYNSSIYVSRSLLLEREPEQAYVLADMILQEKPGSLAAQALQKDAEKAMSLMLKAGKDTIADINRLSGQQVFIRRAIAVLRENHVGEYSCPQFNIYNGTYLANLLLRLDPRCLLGYLLRAQNRIFPADSEVKPDYSAALSDAEAALRLAPNDTTAWELKAKAYAGQGNIPAAIAAYSRVLEIVNVSRLSKDYYSSLHSQIIDVLAARAKCYMEAKNYAAAQADYKAAIAIAPEFDEQSELLLADAIAEGGDHDSARALLVSLRKEPRFKQRTIRAALEENISWECLFLRKFDEAIAAGELALRLDPDNCSDAAANVGHAFLLKGDLKAALLQYHRWLDRGKITRGESKRGLLQKEFTALRKGGSYSPLMDQALREFAR